MNRRHKLTILAVCAACLILLFLTSCRRSRPAPTWVGVPAGVQLACTWNWAHGRCVGGGHVWECVEISTTDSSVITCASLGTPSAESCR